VRRAETGDAVVEVAREIEGSPDGRPFRPRPVAADRDLAAGIRRPARGKARAHGLGPGRA
jgi:hypothetical protein